MPLSDPPSQTPQEQRRVEEALEYARRIGDAGGIEITLAQLSGPCPAWGRSETR